MPEMIKADFFISQKDKDRPAREGKEYSLALVSLGCDKNRVDSEIMLGMLGNKYLLTEDAMAADIIIVNTCGFIDAAKKDSIDTLLAASEHKSDGVQAVVAVGCMAERYGAELAQALPEADAVLGFDDYPDIAERLHWILDGGHVEAHQPRDRRKLLPLAPASRPQAASEVTIPGHGWIPRMRLAQGATAPLKIASGCDRRCAFCAIPSFRGSYLSRPIDEVVAEAEWLVNQGVREAVLVSENSSAYGKDLGTNLETLLAALNRVDGLDWLRVSYLQPAEMRPSLLQAMTNLEHVVPYFDLPFQHASAPVLRRMRRFGDANSFADLIARIRALRPDAGIRSNVIVGFPGETDADLATLLDFLAGAELDAVGVFGYSDEEGTEGATLGGKISDHEIDQRVDQVATLVEEISAIRASDRIGERVQVLVESSSPNAASGRIAQQGPETDGSTSIRSRDSAPKPGTLLYGRVTDSDGVDLVVEGE